MSLTHDDVERILRIIDQLGERDVKLEFGDLKIHISRGGRTLDAGTEARPQQPPQRDAPPVPPVQAAPQQSAQPSSEEPVPAGMVAIRAPMVGTFYRAPAPGAQPFVEIGQSVGADDTLCLLEVMKLFNSIRAGVPGRVAKILVENGAAVAHRQLLMLIEQDQP